MAVEAEEERFMEEVNRIGLAASEHASSQAATCAQMRAAQSQLQIVEGANALRDLFYIWTDGPFGTISGLRLGRTPDVPVPWEEINAAWGQCVLLLHSLAHQCHVTFSGWNLVPCGSFSKVVDRRNQMHCLHGPPKVKVKAYLCPAYDRGMEGFLACVSEFAEYAAQRDAEVARAAAVGGAGGGQDAGEEASGAPGASESGMQGPLELPYPIRGDRVGGMSVRLSMNKESKWTAALKMMLADLAVLQAWVVERATVRGK